MKADTITKALEQVTKKWTKQRKAEERDARARLNRRSIMTIRDFHVSIRDAAFGAMEQAYLHASGGGTLPVKPRQVMYAARRYIIEHADREVNSATIGNYFSQTLLPGYMEMFPERTADWDIVLDARGRFIEPHTDLEVPLGTLEVRSYLSALRKFFVQPLNLRTGTKRFPTLGPENAFSAVLFIEKEGFGALFDRVRLAERHDIGIMSTKGLSVTACRMLIDFLGGVHKLPIFALHDFDKAGFSIVATLARSSSRYQFEHKVKVIDLGLRLEDVEAEGLDYEEVSYPRMSRRAIEENLRRNGATKEEVEFLTTTEDGDTSSNYGVIGRRVELNAFTSDAFVEWIERKLDEHGVRKVVPKKQTLVGAYDRLYRQIALQPRIVKMLTELPVPKPPTDLKRQIVEALDRDPTLRWDEALGHIIEDLLKEERK
jgi:hypothetical protein